MRILSRIFRMWLLGRTVSSSTPILLRLVTAVAAIAVLAMIGFLFFALLVTGVLWTGYLQLVAQGLSQAQAVAALSGLLLLVLVGIAASVRGYMQQTMRLLGQLAFAHAPVSGRVSLLIDAFVRGYKSP